MQKNNIILAIVPHGDDEVLMCGGTLHKLSKINQIHVAFVRKPHDKRTKKQLNATKEAQNILGILKLHYLNISEFDTANEFLTLKTSIEQIVSHVQPQIIFTTFYGDNHQDHQNLFRAVSVACRHQNALSVKHILVGEISSSTDQYLGPHVFHPTVFINLTEKDIQAKINAMAAYETESRKDPHPRSSENMRALAKVRGAKINAAYAEAFMCIKSIWD